jgi:hypothetical protein
MHYGLNRCFELNKASYLRDNKVGKFVCREFADGGNILLKERAIRIMHACAYAIETIIYARKKFAYEFCMCRFIAGSRAIFTIKRDIEDGAKLLLKRERFAHQLF